MTKRDLDDTLNLIAWIVVALILLAISNGVSAELILELGVGHTYPTDTLGDNRVTAQPIGTVELGYEHKSGFGVSVLHVSNPLEEDYGINMIRVTKRFKLFN